MTREEAIEELRNMQMDECSVLDNKSLQDFFTKQAHKRYEVLSLAISALREVDELKTVLSAWHDVFGTTQLTHAKDKLDSALQNQERLVKALKEILMWLKDCDGQLIEHDHGVPYDHIRIAEETAKLALAKKGE